jgi:hypothetical protein
MTNSRFPKQVFYSQLRDGSSTPGGQKKHFHDLKAQLKKQGRVGYVEPFFTFRITTSR